MQTFGEKLTLLRRQNGVSQEELAFGIGVSRQTVSNWENDKINPLSENIVALCGYFNVKPEYFLSDGAVLPAVKSEDIPEPNGESELSITAYTENENEVSLPAENQTEEKPKKKSRKKLFLIALAIVLSVAVLILLFFAYLYAPEEGEFSSASSSTWNFGDITTVLELSAGILAFAVLCIAVYFIIVHFKNKKK